MMKKLIALALALMAVLTLMLPALASADAAPAAMWVNTADGKNLNVRAEPRTGSKILYRIQPGTRVTVMNNVQTQKGWAFVMPDGHRDGGFVMTKFLQAKQPGKYEITERDDSFRAVTPYTVTAKALNDRTVDSVGLRTAPNKTASMIRRLAAGDMLQVVAVGKVWSQVLDLATGRTGYVANDYIQKI